MDSAVVVAVDPLLLLLVMGLVLVVVLINSIGVVTDEKSTPFMSGATGFDSELASDNWLGC